MRKIVVIGISILSVFILCSLSYQPIIADTPIENIPIIKKSKASNLDVDELKELYNKLIEMKSQSNDDCDCEDTTGWDFPIICELIVYIILIGMLLLININKGKVILLTALILADIFNCN